MTYQEAVELIDEKGRRPKLAPIYLRLDRMRLIFNEINLDPTWPAVHVAGTSGKGSTSSLCASVLQQAGYKVGLHTSPHLQSPRERLQINGHMPSEAEFAKLTETVYRAAKDIEQNHSYGAFTTHELIFTIAALHFQRHNCDILIIETFMGGQFDPTNIISPLVSVVTNVDLDHTRLLGKTIESIATVKAGVIKPNTPFITGATQPSVIKILQKRTADLGVQCIVIGQDNQVQSRLLGLKGSILSAKVLDNLFANLHLRLLGRHQINNALLVLTIIQVLRSRGWLIADLAIRSGFSQAFIPGRLEIVDHNPLTILDGAHNPAKIKALVRTLKRIFKGRKIIFIFALKKGKPIKENLQPLIPLTHKMIVTSFGAKAQSTSLLRRTLMEQGVEVTTRVDPLSAWQLAKNQSPKDAIICITGSLHLVGKLRQIWHPANRELNSLTLEDKKPTTMLGEALKGYD